MSNGRSKVYTKVNLGKPIGQQGNVVLPVMVTDERGTRSEEIRRRKTLGLKLEKQGEIFYDTPDAGKEVYSVAQHELVFERSFVSFSHPQSGTSHMPMVRSSFNNDIIDQNKPDRLLGVADTSDGLGAGDQIWTGKISAAIAGTRTIMYHNDQGLSVLCGDLVAWDYPSVKVDAEGRRSNASFRGAPSNKLTAQVFPVNFYEDGGQNAYTTILNALIHPGPSAGQYLEPIKDVLMTMSNPASSEEEKEKALKSALAVADFEESHFESMARRIYENNKDIYGDKDKDDCLVSIKEVLTMFLPFIRLVSKHAAFWNHRVFGISLKNTADGNATDVLLTRVK